MAEENTNDFWFRKIGFYNNPFSIKPAPFDFRVFGQEDILDELTYRVPAGTMSFVEGDLGTGKSTIMKHLIHKFRGKGKIIFFSCNRINNDLNIEQLLINKYGLFGKMFKVHPKDMLVFLDEAQELSAENTERIKYFFDHGNIKSVVFTGTDYEEVKFHESIKERIGEDGLLRVNALKEDDAIALIRDRIGNLNILSDEMIKKVWNLAKKNPRRLLQKCDKACKYVVDNGDLEFTEEHLKKVFDEKSEIKEEKKKADNSPKKKLSSKKKKDDEKKEKAKEIEEDPEENLYEADEEI